MTEELQRLRQDQNLDATLNITSLNDAFDPPDLTNDTHTIKSTTSPNDNVLLGAVEAASLGPHAFSEEDIRNRARIYTEHFHPYFPLLDLPLQIGLLQKYSPLLFWAIMIITCRYQPLDISQQKSFEAEFTALLQRLSMTTPLTLHTIQALVLMCVWPLPAVYQLSDPSCLYCSVAGGAADFLNLNRPVNKHQYQGSQLTDSDLSHMSKTLLAIFCVSTWLEMYLGTPRLFKFARDIANIEAHVSRAAVPPALAAEAAIMAVAAKHHSLTVSEMSNEALGAVAEMHLASVDSIKQQFSTIWSQHLEFVALSVKLQLQVSVFVSQIRNNEDRSWSPMDNILATSTSFARSIIEIIEFLIPAAPTAGQNYTSAVAFKILPKSYFRATTYATFFLFKFYYWNKKCREQDRTESRQLINRAREVFRRSSAQIGGPSKGDEPGRAYTLLGALLRADFAGTDDLKLKIDDRGGSSIVWDVLRRAYQIRGRATNRTDLLECIDPLRSVNHKGTLQGHSEDAEAFMAQYPPEQFPAADLSDDAWYSALLELPDYQWWDASILDASLSDLGSTPSMV